MSWHYLRGRGEEYLVDICSGGEPFAPLRSKTTHAEFYCNGKLTESYLDSLYGTTYAHSTENRGKEKLTSSAEDSLAKTSASQGKGLGLTGSEVDFGKKWPELLAKFDPGSYLWRTPQCSLFEDSTECLETLPRWGMTQNGELSELTMPRHLTSEIEFGYSLPTPTTVPEAPNKNSNSNGQKNLLEVAQGKWNHIWPTPLKSDFKNRGPNSKQQGLSEVVRIWPTPTAHNAKETNAPSEAKRNTPTLASRVGGHLNPDWVEWLMGWPIGWTDLKQLEMDKFRQWLHSHGKH